jgi:murein DD-endopeptidase MepM/ murein hydrolase activator NlpD
MNKDWKEFVFKKAERLISKASTPLSAKEVAWRTVKFAVACGQSNPLSFALRPMVDHKHLRQVIGINLVVLALAAAVWGPIPSLASDTGGVPSIAVLPEGEVKINTVESVKWPAASRDISQKFWLLHAGVDIRMPEGTAINPVMAGRVREIELGKYGYGIKVVIGHENKYKSLYAHLSETRVKVGDLVNTDQVIGLSGNTGRSTGPHLHLEIHHNDKPVNPLLILGNK